MTSFRSGKNYARYTYSAESKLYALYAMWKNFGAIAMERIGDK